MEESEYGKGEYRYGVSIGVEKGWVSLLFVNLSQPLQDKWEEICGR